MSIKKVSTGDRTADGYKDDLNKLNSHLKK